MTLTTTEELKHLASSDNANELTRRLARECLANREAQPVGYIDPDSLKEYRGQRAGGTWSAVQRTTSGLNMTTPIYTAPPAPAVPPEATPENIENLLADITLFFTAGSLSHGGSVMFAEVWNACRAAMLKGARP